MLDELSAAAEPAEPRPAARRPRFGHYVEAMRLPFTSVAVVPYLTGVYLAHAHGVLTAPLAAGAGAVAVLLLCIGCYLSGEIFDQREDVETLRCGRNPFSGGTLLVANGTLPERRIGALSIAAFALAVILGVLVVVRQRSLVLLGLGVFGAAAATLYSVPPVRLVTRGVGEVLIGVCYGWLTLVTGFASAAGRLPPHSGLLALPIACSVFNIIFINEFPDYEPDRTTGKRTLLVRVGRRAGAFVYALAALATGGSLLVIWHRFRAASVGHLIATAPVIALSVWLAIGVGARGRWRDPRELRLLCALTIILNLAAAIAVGVLARWS
jgi:1,4-dihydroxy-2-naphthoate octaprenyltransferase